MTTTSAPQQTAVALIKEDRDGKGLLATGAFERFQTPFLGKARPGDLLEISTGKKPSVIQKLGRPSSIESVITALALHAGERAHSPGHERLAAEVAAKGESYERRDLRELATFTIDGASTKDFDDAISARREGERIRVWVHVADVTAFIRPGSELDCEARRRASSVYLPTLTVPMLPEALSNGVCSLLPGSDRAAVTCELLLENGRVVERCFYRSLIRSDARLTYDHVEEIFLGRTEPGPTYAAALKAARRAAIDRELERSESRSEPYFEIRRGQVVAIRERHEQESQRLIERLMVLANQEVAHFLSERGAPTLYRTHAAADPERQRRMLARIRSLGIKPRSESIDGALAAIAGDPREPVLTDLILSSRAPAAYERELTGHEGLGLASYTHFTSPIRRYSDLIVHRALLAEISAEPIYQSPRHVELPELAEHLNERTRAVKKLSRRAESICRVSLLRRLIKQGKSKRELDGTVVGIGRGGCYVACSCVEGLIGARRLGGGPNLEETIWKPARGKRLAIGDRVRVKIRRIDPVRGQLDLELLSD